MKLFLDTNVLIDYFARRTPFFSSWTQLRCAQHLHDVELWVSAKSFTDAFYVLSGTCRSAEIQKAFLASLDFLKVCCIDGDDIAAAALLEWSDFEDCLIDIAAQKVGADYLLTRDVQGFKQAKTPSLSPAAFLAMLQNTFGIEYQEIELDHQTWHVSIDTDLACDE